MPTIFDYIATMDALSLDSTGGGFGVFPLFTGTGTGTCGCVALADLPALTGDGVADWAPIGVSMFPPLDSTGTTAGYHPAWGDPELPALTGDGAGHVLIESMSLLPPLYATGQCGAAASADIPAVSGYALSGYNRSASCASMLPLLAASASSCGIDNALTTSATSSAVVALLQQGNLSIADAAATICAGLTTDDAKVAAIARYVAGFSYVSDGAGIGDRWTCALATLQRKYGDCEDGAILIQSLLLAAGIDAGRVMTCFGTAGDTSTGHAWTIYRRESDEEWVPLEWTDSVFASLTTVDIIKRMVDRTDVYKTVTHILTSTAFTTVTTADWIKQVTTLSADGACTVSLPTATGQTNIIGKASMAIPALSADIRAGLRQGLALPKLTSTATASQAYRSTGVCTLPELTITGRTGAHGDGAVPKLQASGATGASGYVALPALTTDTSGTSRILVTASMRIPAAQGTGTALVGSIGQGVMGLPSLVARGTNLPSLSAAADLILAHLDATGMGGIVSTADAALAFPRLLAMGHMTSVPAWASQILRYDEVRIA